jgi:branched-chain amino acid transport system ATP-binding protein
MNGETTVADMGGTGWAADATSSASPLRVAGLTAGYGDLAAVRDVSIEVKGGEITVLLGPNGAGKTTLMNAIAGLLPLMAGDVYWNGTRAKEPYYIMARKGLAFVPEGKSIVPSLSVKENLQLGKAPLEDSLKYFPQLQGLLNRPAGLLSGGEQQMLALGRALGQHPTVLLADELSLGLAPLVVDSLYEAIAAACQADGLAALVVEQQTWRALDVSQKWYAMRNGRIVGAGTSPEEYIAIGDDFLGSTESNLDCQTPDG